LRYNRAVLPEIIYGTAWKEDRTAGLVRAAAAAGYRAFDTANQKKHYREDYAGDALRELMGAGLSREELFLQSKYTDAGGQDRRLPYDPDADYATQVRASFADTLAHFRTDYLDSFLVHGPLSAAGLTDEDWEIWGAMEKLKDENRARLIGVSNVGLPHLRGLCAQARLKPMIVQNRCYASRGWDGAVREYCLANGIVYQGFSLLTANPHVVAHARVAAIARCRNVTPEQVVFGYARRIGIVPLTGTTDEGHMKEDLASVDLELSAADAEAIAAL
jgi:diketogulonate reductase-like aldo/keto reductase